MPPPPPQTTAETASPQPAKLVGSPSPAEIALERADAWLEAGEIKRARRIYFKVLRKYPGTPPAEAALRSLLALESTPEEEPQAIEHQRASSASGFTAGDRADLIVSETAFGLVLGGFSVAGAGTSDYWPLVLGGALGGGAATAFSLIDKDRGDVPLVLGLTSLVPATVYLAFRILPEIPNERSAATASAWTGMLSVPAAMILSQFVSPDPARAELVRQGADWGLLLGALGGRYAAPSALYQRWNFGAALLGLYFGLGMGVLAANALPAVEVDSVRLTAIGGYVGVGLGYTLESVFADGRQPSLGTAIGGLAGLGATALTLYLADRPRRFRSSKHASLTPTLVPVVESSGRLAPALGLAGWLP